MKTRSAFTSHACVPRGGPPAEVPSGPPRVFGPPVPIPVGAGRAAMDALLAGLTFHRFDIAVADLEAAREFYTVALGVEVWQSRALAGTVWRRGQAVPLAGTLVAEGTLGSGFVRLVEPAAGHTVAREALERRGEGLFAIGYQVDDPVTALGAALAAGTAVEQLGPDPVHPAEIYLDGGSGLLFGLLHRDASALV
ncbi:VOC family protein [Frankia sp. R82]|uniref:VOC family protein n=1 Tax=Frankia sp. R82 TaxID=2950553 RepID=UPI0020432EE9|nr:VOC family protein [Frankia sp. R82]MCM3885472.1 VOC family protein [Frankia sp. R82]